MDQSGIETAAVDRVETDFFIAERIWPGPDRVITVGDTVFITLRVTAKTRLEYILWREIIGGYAVNEVGSSSDLEFMYLAVHEGARVEWKYDLRGIREGTDTIDGVIKAAYGSRSSDARLKAQVLVRR